MKKNYCVLVLLLWCNIIQAQNLVSNGSFELYTGCPTNYSQIDSALFWTAPNVISSSDYYNQCADLASNAGVPLNGPGFQEAQNGNAYSGIYLIFPSGSEYREYIEVPLTDTLTAGGCYYFEMYVNLTNTCKLTTDAIGAYFSDTAITGVNDFFPLPLMPQIINSAGNTFDTLNWTKVSGSYIAEGNETHLIIGNFKDDANTDLILVNENAPFSFVYVLIDNVFLGPCKATSVNETAAPAIKVYPNPFSDYLNIQMNNNAEAELLIYDLSFRKLLQQKFVQSLSIGLQAFDKGSYIYEIRAGSYRMILGMIQKQ